MPSVRGVGWDAASNRIVIGTAGSEIYELSSLNGVDCNNGPVIQGHFQGQTWGLDCHPTKVRPGSLLCKFAVSLSHNDAAKGGVLGCCLRLLSWPALPASSTFFFTRVLYVCLRCRFVRSAERVCDRR